MDILLSIAILIMSAVIHEVCHGLVAERLGDPTPRLFGRLTLNPKVHIDPIMSILVPLLLIVSGSPIIFGGAKPMPVDPFNLKEGRKDMALVALAGPLSNIILALGASGLFNLLYHSSLGTSSSLAIIGLVLLKIAIVNLYLAIFNLLPIPPLDGSNIFALLLPDKEAKAYLSLGSIGIFIIFFLLSFPIGGFSLSTLINRLFEVAQNLIGLGYLR